MREKSKFIKQFSAESAVQSCTQKYFSFGKSEIMPLTAASRLGKRGVRVVTDVERGMRWTRRCRQTNDIGADGEVVWSWRPLAGAKLATMLLHRADDGDSNVMDTGESAKQAVKTNRAGKAGVNR